MLFHAGLSASCAAAHVLDWLGLDSRRREGLLGCCKLALGSGRLVAEHAPAALQTAASSWPPGEAHAYQGLLTNAVCAQASLLTLCLGLGSGCRLGAAAGGPALPRALTPWVHTVAQFLLAVPACECSGCGYSSAKRGRSARAIPL